MRGVPCVLIGICVLFAAPASMSQSDPQRPAESPSQQMTVPPAQQPPQQRQHTQRPPEQAASQPEAAQGKAAQHSPVAEEKSSVTHHSARIGGQEIKYIATAATYNIKADDGTPNERRASPNFLIGDSYGTTRSAELAAVLQERHQIYLSGIALLSSVAFSNWGADNRSEFFLPTYTTTAWYHHLLPSDLQNLTVEQVAQQAREFAHGEYAAALEKGDALSPAEHQKVVADVARFTALTPKYIEETNLRINPFRWFKELERDKRRTIGRLDSRFEGMDADAAGERVE